MTEHQPTHGSKESQGTSGQQAVTPQDRALLERATQILSDEELARFKQGDFDLLQRVLSAPEEVDTAVSEPSAQTSRRRSRGKKTQSQTDQRTPSAPQESAVDQALTHTTETEGESNRRGRPRKQQSSSVTEAKKQTQKQRTKMESEQKADQQTAQADRSEKKRQSESRNGESSQPLAPQSKSIKPMYTREELEGKKANELRALIDRFQLKPSNRRSREVLIGTILEYAQTLAKAQQAIDFKKQGDETPAAAPAETEDKDSRGKRGNGADKQGNRTHKKSRDQHEEHENEQKVQRNKRFERKENKNNHSDKGNGRRNRRDQRSGERRYTREYLEGLKAQELRSIVDELGLTAENRKSRTVLIDCILADDARRHAMVTVEGILDVLPEGYGFLRTQGYLPSETDVYVNANMIRKCGLRRGDLVKGEIKQRQNSERYPALQVILQVDGLQVDQLRARPNFTKLTPIYPDEHLKLEHGKDSITGRAIDLVAPIGKGQRGLIVSPPKAGKTTILKRIAESIAANNPEVILICLLVDERPEEVTDMERSISGEVVASTFDMPWEQHIAVSELVIERAKRLVEGGRDVVILLDSITRLARAYNLAQPASGRILSGGVDSTALYPPKKFLGAARNIEGGGSLTILASALVDTGSKMDEVIFEEFKGTGNMELKLDRELADRRIFPAIDPVASGTRQEQLLIEADQLPFIWSIRRLLANMNNTERAMDMLLKSLRQTGSNGEFLLRSARKAQQQNGNATL